jgi:hypothetical protein
MMTKEMTVYFVNGNPNNPAGIFKKSAAGYRELHSSSNRSLGQTVSTPNAGN